MGNKKHDFFFPLIFHGMTKVILIRIQFYYWLLFLLLKSKNHVFVTKKCFLQVENLLYNLHCIAFNRARQPLVSRLYASGKPTQHNFKISWNSKPGTNMPIPFSKIKHLTGSRVLAFNKISTKTRQPPSISRAGFKAS